MPIKSHITSQRCSMSSARARWLSVHFGRVTPTGTFLVSLVVMADLTCSHARVAASLRCGSKAVGPPMNQSSSFHQRTRATYRVVFFVSWLPTGIPLFQQRHNHRPIKAWEVQFPCVCLAWNWLTTQQLFS